MNANGLAALVAIADTESITRAAELLHYSPSGICRQLATLEKSLGFKVYNRTRDGIELTPGGVEVLPTAREVTQALARLADNRRDAAFALAGTRAPEDVRAPWPGRADMRHPG